MTKTARKAGVRGSWGWDDLTVEIYAITQEEADMIMDLINSAERTASYDERSEIIRDEAAAFLQARRAPRDGAVIQSRVNIYVNDRYKRRPVKRMKNRKARTQTNHDFGGAAFLAPSF